jgi:predicted nucleic acid-binding protein
MSGLLLDTNILSELRKGSHCDAGVRNWVESITAEEMFVSVLVLGEIRQGVERIRMRDQNQARALEKWLQSISTEFADRILPVDERVVGSPRLAAAGANARRFPGGDGTRSRSHRGQPGRGRFPKHGRAAHQSFLEIQTNGQLNG